MKRHELRILLGLLFISTLASCASYRGIENDAEVMVPKFEIPAPDSRSPSKLLEV